MVDRTRNLSKPQKIVLGLTAVLTTFCMLCCGCVGLIALLPSDENAAVAQATSEIIEAETLSENVQRESVTESAPEPGNTPPPPTNNPSTPINSPEPTNTPRPTNTARPSPTLPNEPETGQTTMGSGAEVTGDLAIGDLAAVTRIIDGDTIEVEINGQTYRLRYIGMDTPERGDPFFDEATEANRQLVEGQTVTLVKDVSETDRYGRLLRYVYLADGTFVNAELVKQGFALVATFPPDVAHQSEFTALQEEARNTGAGLWGQTVATNTPQPTSPPLPTNTSQPVQTATAPPQPTNTSEAAPTAVSTPEPVPTAVPVPPTEPPPPPPSNCDPSYPTVCIPPPPPDLDCGQIPYRNFTVLEPDPHGFDRDNDGVGCES